MSDVANELDDLQFFSISPFGPAKKPSNVVLMNTITFLIQPPYLVLRLISAILANEMVTFYSLDHHSIRKRQKLLLSAHFERLFALVFKARAILC